MIDQEFVCKCGKFKMWIGEDRKTKPCPNCGRTYIGKYDKKELSIKAEEI